jgi:hypothetical protein
MIDQDIGFASPINKKKDYEIYLLYIINELKKLFKFKIKRKGEKI